MSTSDETDPRHNKKYLTAKQLSSRWGDCSLMFIERRLKNDPRMPRPMKFTQRLRLFDLDQIEAYERACVHARGDEAA
jgi:hypothetical protein